MPPYPTILVVDDDPIVLTIMRRVLERDGYRVLTASDGNTGLALAEQESPSLVVVDLMMPVRNGFQLVEKLKSRPNAVPRVIMITASEGERPQAHALKLGVDDYLHKPLEIEQILASVHRLCPLTSHPTETPTVNPIK